MEKNDDCIDKIEDLKNNIIPIIVNSMVTKEISSLQFNLLNRLDSVLNENTKNLNSHLDHYREIFNREKELIEMNMEILATEVVHKIVNGNLVKINEKLSSISDEILKIKDSQVDYDLKNDEKIGYIKEKVLYYAIAKALEKNPVKTITIFSITSVLIAYLLYRIYELDSIFSSIFKYIVELIK